MQELRSTEILDKEIQSDARKKAEKILKKADADSAELISSVDMVVEKAKKEKQDFYNKKLTVLKNDQEASIPLEKQRLEVSFIQNELIKNINAYISNLSEEQIFEMVSRNCSVKIDRKVNAFIYGFELESAKKMLAKFVGSNLNKCEKTEFGKISLEDDCGLEKNMGIILESEDKTFRLRLSLSEVISRLLNTNRAELTAALFGGQL